MSESTEPAPIRRSGGERPVNLILPVVTAVVGFVIGFLLSDISKSLAPNELPTPQNMSNFSSPPGERDGRPAEVLDDAVDGAGEARDEGEGAIDEAGEALDPPTTPSP